MQRIKTLLYDERLTLEGAKKRLLAEARGTHQLDLGLKSATLEEALRRIRERLRALRERLTARADGPRALSFAPPCRTIVTGSGRGAAR